MPGRSEILQAVGDYNSKKHLEEFYKTYLSKIGKSVEPGEQLETDVRHIFHWFLGKVSTKESPEAEHVEIANTAYYIYKAAPSNMESIKKAVLPENLWAGLAFKNESLPLDNFLNYASAITKKSIVLPAFYVHIFKPYEYPILNSNVWTAYREELGKNVFINTKPVSWDNYMGYISYCSYLKRKYGLSLREIDKGLWVIGERLREKARKDSEENEKEPKTNQYELYDM
jgi:hypothetical protein